MTYKEFAEIIKRKREDLFLTQKEFATQIPMPNSAYNKVENARQEPSFFQLQRICLLLDIDISALWGIKKT